MRCRGHCCQSFSVGPGYRHAHLLRMADWLRKYKAAQSDEEEQDVARRAEADGCTLHRDVDLVADMVISLGVHDRNPVFGTAVPYPVEFYTCRHLQPNGDCGNYDGRPQLCRTYGTCGTPCEYQLCASRPLLEDRDGT